MPSSGSTYVVSASGVLSAPPHRVYETIANYNTRHPRILARQISGLEVEQGGIGEGTVIRFQVTAFGKTESLRAEITEPEPGHMLVETALGRHSITTFVVDSGAHAGESVVTIKTELTARPGLGGLIERLLTRRLLRSMYREQLRLLEAVAAGPPGTAASTNSRA